MLLGVVFLLFLLDGVGLEAGWRRVFSLGLPVARGRVRLAVPIEPAAPLPEDPGGALGRWIGPDAIGWWSGAVRFGFKGGRMFRALWGVGAMFSGTAVLDPDRQGAAWCVRLRLPPLLLVLGVCALAFAQFGALGGALPLLACVMFGSFYAIFAGIAWVSTRRARAVVLGPDDA